MGQTTTALLQNFASLYCKDSNIQKF